MSRSPKLDEALDEVRRQIEALVREEQLRDQLTGLANSLALSEWLESATEGGEAYWCALVEVDYFKRINDRFTYALADELLKRIAKRLEAFEDYVPRTLPVRAHGDEFYLVGRLVGPPEVIEEALDRVRGEIGSVQVPTERGSMQCTVSIGWMTTADGGPEVVTARSVLQMVEAAAAAAKIGGRNRVIRYTPEVKKSRRASLRDDCSACRASFTVEIPTDTTHNGPLRCPNCGGELPRPEISAGS